MPPTTHDPSDVDSSDYGQLDSPAGRSSKVATQIRGILESSGIALHNQRRHVQNVLGVAKSTSRRLLLGETAWTDNEITSVLNSVGLDWTGLALVDSKNDALATSSLASTRVVIHPSTINVDGVMMPCEVEEPFPPVHVPVAADALCATGDAATGVTIVRSTKSNAWAQLRRITSIHIQPTYEQTGPLVLVLDDTASTVSTMVKVLRMSGFRAEGFTDPQALMVRCRQNPPADAYLLDWSLQSGENISDYIPEIIVASPRSAIVLMSGNFASSEIDADATLISQQYHLNLLAKPAPPAAVVQTLMMSIKYAHSGRVDDDRPGLSHVPTN